MSLFFACFRLLDSNISCPRLVHTSQNYNALSYDDKIVDGFYDLHGVLTGPTSSKMPSLVELQGTPVSDNVTWEAVVVNKAADSKLLELEQRALEIAVKSVSESVDCAGQSLVQRLAVLVSDHMGGPVRNPDNMLVAWRDFSSRLKGTIGSMVLPLGSLKIGLARHRALLFKVFTFSIEHFFSSYAVVWMCTLKVIFFLNEINLVILW